MSARWVENEDVKNLEEKDFRPRISSHHRCAGRTRQGGGGERTRTPCENRKILYIQPCKSLVIFKPDRKMTVPDVKVEAGEKQSRRPTEFVGRVVTYRARRCARRDQPYHSSGFRPLRITHATAADNRRNTADSGQYVYLLNRVVSLFLKGAYFNRGWSEATAAVESHIWLCAATCKAPHLSRVLLEDFPAPFQRIDSSPECDRPGNCICRNYPLLYVISSTPTVYCLVLEF